MLIGLGLLHAASHIAHTTAHLHGIGCHHTVMLRFVAEHHHIGVKSFFQREMTEIYPCAASHLLIYHIVSRAIKVIHGVMCVAHTFGQCLIRHIHCIFAVFGHFYAPGGCRCAVAVSCHLAIASLGKGVLVVDIIVLCPSKTAAFAGFPRIFAVLLHIVVLRLGAIVVYKHLKTVNIAVAGTHHIGTGILEHRHQEWNNIRLGVKVLYGLIEAGALPLPAIEFGLEIPPVALPEGYHIVAQSLFVVVMCIGHSHKTFVLASIFFLKFFCVVVDIASCYVDAHLVFGIRRSEHAAEALFQPFHIGCSKWNIAISITQCDAYGLFLAIDIYFLYENFPNAHL